MEYDVFICHASEDKSDFVEPLAHALVKVGLRVWYDKFELALGDSLREKIDYGLANSEYGVVVLSKAFFGKNWPKEELDGLAARQIFEGRKIILPVWHGVDFTAVKSFSPTLAGKLAASSEQGLDAVTAQILNVCRQDTSSRQRSVFQTMAHTSLRGKCLDMIRAGDRVGWTTVIDALTQDTVGKLLEWKQSGEAAVSHLCSVSPNLEPWKAAVLDAIRLSLPGLVPVLTAAEMGSEDYWREAGSLLRRLRLLRRDMGGGSSIVLDIGDSVLYVAGAIGMALAARSKQLSFVRTWSNLILPDPEDQSAEVPWWRVPEVNYWPSSLAGPSSDPYKYLVQLLDQEEMRPFFQKPDDFQRTLFAGNLLLSLVEFGIEATRSDYQSDLLDQRFRFNIMPVWSAMKPNAFKNETSRLFASSAEVIRFVCPHLEKTPQEFWPLWQLWKTRCIESMMQNSLAGFLGRPYWLTLPGEPPMKQRRSNSPNERV